MTYLKSACTFSPHLPPMTSEKISYTFPREIWGNIIDSTSDLATHVSLASTCQYFASFYSEDMWEYYCAAQGFALPESLAWPVDPKEKPEGVGSNKQSSKVSQCKWTWERLARVICHHRQICNFSRCLQIRKTPADSLNVLDPEDIQSEKVDLKICDDVSSINFGFKDAYETTLFDHDDLDIKIFQHPTLACRNFTTPPASTLLMNMSVDAMEVSNPNGVTVADFAISFAAFFNDKTAELREENPKAELYDVFGGELLFLDAIRSVKGTIFLEGQWSS